jgi:hypothetical protein
VALSPTNDTEDPPTSAATQAAVEEAEASAPDEAQEAVELAPANDNEPPQEHPTGTD